MPWKSISKEEARKRFVKLLLEARTPMAEACRECRVSRKTGYKWKRRFLAEGRHGLRDRSRCPKRSPRRTTELWLREIRRVRRRHRRWGARKIWGCLRKQFPGRKIPAVRTITRWLERWGLTRQRRRRPPRGPRVWRRSLTEPVRSNQVWTVDFKGWFRTGDGRRVDPLTVKDLTARFDISQPAVSQHLATLKEAGLVNARRDGRSIYYRVEPRGMKPLIDWIAHYRAFWTERVDRLEQLLEKMDE